MPVWTDYGIILNVEGLSIPAETIIPGVDADPPDFNLGRPSRVVLDAQVSFDGATNWTDVTIFLEQTLDEPGGTRRWSQLRLRNALTDNTQGAIQPGGGAAQNLVLYCENARGGLYHRVRVTTAGGVSKAGDKIKLRMGVW